MNDVTDRLNALYRAIARANDRLWFARSRVADAQDDGYWTTEAAHMARVIARLHRKCTQLERG